MGTHHATPSCATFELVIGLATSRVFARLPPGSVQSAAAPVAADWTGFDKQPAVAGGWRSRSRRQPGPPPPPGLRWPLWAA